MEGWETYFSLRVVLEQEGHDLVVTLLESHGQWREAVLHTERCVKISQVGTFLGFRYQIRDGRPPGLFRV